MIIWLISPNLGTCVVRSTGLGVKQAFLCNFRHIHVSQLGGPIFVKEDVRRLQISVEDLYVVQGLQTSNHLDEYFPNFFFLDVLLVLLVGRNFLEKVSVVRVFHHNATSQKN